MDLIGETYLLPPFPRGGALGLGAVAPHCCTARLRRHGRRAAVDAVDVVIRQFVDREKPREMEDMWQEAVRLMELAKFSVDEGDKTSAASGLPQGRCGRK